MSNLPNYIQKFSQFEVAVVGDLMMDKYIFGSATRISQEAPGPVVCVDSEKSVPGGAANVALNVLSLHAKAHVFGVIGEDSAGEELTARFDRADLFCLPGTGGLALQQAMASALPLIAAEADGTQADLVRPENGITVRPGDLSELTGAITKMLSAPVKLRAMGAESFRIVRDEINLEAMASVFAEAVEFTLKNGLRK